MDNTLYTSGIWKKGKPSGTIVSKTDCKCCLDESREYYGGHLIAESILNPNDIILMSESKNLLQLAEMYHDHMKGTDLEKTIPFKIVEEVLNRINNK